MMPGLLLVAEAEVGSNKATEGQILCHQDALCSFHAQRVVDCGGCRDQHHGQRKPTHASSVYLIFMHVECFTFFDGHPFTAFSSPRTMKTNPAINTKTPAVTDRPQKRASRCLACSSRASLCLSRAADISFCTIAQLPGGP